MIEREVSIATADGSMRAYVVHPDTPSPPVVVYMAASGYDDAMKAVTRKLAERGFYCVLPDLFHRLGDDVAFDYAKLGDREGEEFARMQAAVAQTTDAMVVADTRPVLEHVDADPLAAAGPKGCVGFGRGGRHVLGAMLAYPDDLVVGSVLHPAAIVTDGPDSPHLAIGAVGGEIYLGFGELDVNTPPSVVAIVEEEIDRSEAPRTLEVHEGCDHAFALPAARAYRPEAAERALAATTAILQRNLVREPASS